MEIGKRETIRRAGSGTVARVLASTLARGPHLARSGTSPQCVPTADSSRSIIYERRRRRRRRATFRILEHPCQPPSGLTPPKQAEVAPVDAASARKSRHLRDSRARYIEFGHGPPLAPSRSRFRSRYEKIVRDNYAANRSSIRHGNRIF